ncbi:hypothetical protein P8452_27797 [Trifolium repens]|nr:hypothetical protein P8452_03478 [Trifolium repens]WJX40308.1 hypothetical protein P8452_27797 [Trifolium repens]
MASSSSSSRNVMIYAVDDAEPIIVDGSNFVSEPDMTSVEDNIWGEELLIPHKLRGRTLAFAGPLPSSDNFTEDAIETGFAALQQRTPKGASKAKGATTSTDTTTPGATQKKTLPNTGAKVRKRNLMASSEAEGPIKQKKQKALTIQEPSSAGHVNPTNATLSGEGQGDQRKAEIERETEIPVSDPPVEDRPNNNVEDLSTEGPILEKINPSLQDPGTQGDNEEQPTAPFNNDEGHTKENNECHEAGGSNPCSRCISREG